MDINGTRFHLLTGADDWEPLLASRGAVGLWWDRERAGLGLAPLLPRFQRGSPEVPLVPEQRRGADRDRHGNTFWINDAGDGIRVLPQRGGTAADYWRVPDPARRAAEERAGPGDFAALTMAPAATAPRLSGLAVTLEHYLVAGTLEPGGLLVFDLHGGGPPSWRQWPTATDFRPFDLAAAPDGGLWVLEREASEHPARLWRLDRHFRVCAWGGEYQELPPESTDFRPITEGPSDPVPRRLPRGIALDAGSPVTLDDPVSVQGLPDGSALVLGAGAAGMQSVVQRYRDGRLENNLELAGEMLGSVLAESNLKAHDMAFRPERSGPEPDEVRGELVLVLQDGNQAVAFELEAFRDEMTLTIRPRYLPLRRFRGRALVAGAEAVYYDLGEQWYPLTEQPRYRYRSEASIDGLVFDGREPACRWHRLVVDACIPPGTRLQVMTRAADERHLLADQDWHAEPVPYRRADGAEIVLHQPYSEDERRLQGSGTWELLLQRAEGRFIELHLQLTGTGRATPRIRALRLYYPRFSYLERFLPAVYREDRHSASFLERYLANVEGTFTVLEERIARAEAILDTRTAPPEYLEWLAGWLGAALDQSWDAARRRLLIDHAELLFRWRGTPAGMRAAIRLVIDPCPGAEVFDELRNPRGHRPGGHGGRSVRIVERYLYRRLPGVAIGDPTEPATLGRLDLTALDPAGDRAELNRRFRRFLRWRYVLRADVDQHPLAALNQAWGTQFASFDQVEYTPDEAADGTATPSSSVQALADRAQFSRCELGRSRLWSRRDPERLNRRYREFLERRYSERAGSAGDPLAALNAEWGTSFGSFEAVSFVDPQSPAAVRMEAPQEPAQRADWLRFAQRERALVGAWSPEQGTYALHVRYQEALRRRYGAAQGEADALAALNDRWAREYDRFEAIRFSPVLPQQPGAAEDWLRFLRNEIGFNYEPVAADQAPSYRQFLARRYRRIEALNRAYGRVDSPWPSFDAVGLPAEDAFPEAAPELADWIRFVSLSLPIRRNAHRFTVLVPTEPGELPERRAERIAHVEAVVRREKPAHTNFQVRLFWALFQVGSARLGEDTVVGDGARYVAVVLGGTYLGQGLLGRSQPLDAANRRVLGRDPLPRSPQGDLEHD